MSLEQTRNKKEQYGSVLYRCTTEPCLLKRSRKCYDRPTNATLNPITCNAVLIVSSPDFGEYVREDDNACLPKHTDTSDDAEWKLGHTTGGDVDPDGEQGDGEEVVEEDERLSDNTREQSNRTVNAFTASLEVTEATELESFELWVVGGEQRVESLSEDVDDAGQVLAAPMEDFHLFQDGRNV